MSAGVWEAEPPYPPSNDTEWSQARLTADNLLHSFSGVSGAQKELSFYQPTPDINSREVVQSRELPLFQPAVSEWCELAHYFALAGEGRPIRKLILHPPLKGNRVVWTGVQLLPLRTSWTCIPSVKKVWLSDLLVSRWLSIGPSEKLNKRPLSLSTTTQQGDCLL